MHDALDIFTGLKIIDQNMTDSLVAKGIPGRGLGNASTAGDVIKTARGSCSADGRFDPDETGTLHLAFLAYAVWFEPVDVVCWLPRTGSISSYCGRAFALGAEQIQKPGAYCFSQGMLIHSSVLNWLKAGRQGIFILMPRLAFDELRDVPAITAENRQHGNAIKSLLQPQRIPKILVRAPALEDA